MKCFGKPRNRSFHRSVRGFAAGGNPAGFSGTLIPPKRPRDYQKHVPLGLLYESHSAHASQRSDLSGFACLVIGPLASSSNACSLPGCIVMCDGVCRVVCVLVQGRFALAAGTLLRRIPCCRTHIMSAAQEMCRKRAYSQGRVCLVAQLLAQDEAAGWWRTGAASLT
ncbi:hypothetical protein EJ04DRAFT_601705 [Polyplosphaeria fusca]|uniref:Uncharacterized protein n=1 Tax=Polyplosphaeria fusca TaxID=682080 RepID=A0A9P4R0W0_9PLEO|nr:hypothetical protein EJ04DRAFT_601705 [Polyplosphaeria fusca]